MARRTFYPINSAPHPPKHGGEAGCLALLITPFFLGGFWVGILTIIIGGIVGFLSLSFFCKKEDKQSKG